MATDRELLDWSISQSRGQAGAAVGSAQSGVDAILAQRPNVNRAIGQMNNAAGAMLPIADTLKGYGNSMWESGTKVTNQALETLDTGLGFINMDSSASPLVAEAVRLYGQFDPDKYVASAAQDVQSSFDNARGQTERSLARMGVSPSSGAAMSARSKLEQTLATTRAAAMFRAQQQGQKDQASAFQSLIAQNADTFLKTGGQLASIGSSAQGAAVSAQKGASDVLGEAGKMYGSAAGLGLDYGNALKGAYSTLSSVQANQAKNTIDSEALRVNAVNGRAATGGSGVNIIDNTDRAIQARLAAGKDPIATA